MDANLELLVCSNFQAEVEAIVRMEDWQDVQVTSFERMCGHPQQKILPPGVELIEVLGKENVVVINCQKMQPELAAENFFQLPQCVNILINPSLVQEAVKRGYYILTPGWLARWSDHIKEWGFDQTSARQYFKESISGLLLLDTGIDEKSAAYLGEFSKYLDIQSTTFTVGLDYLRLYLTQIVSTWRKKKSIDKIEAMNLEANRATADYAMVIDLLTRLAQAHSEEEVQSEVGDLFTMLFAKGDVFYFPINNGSLSIPLNHTLSVNEQETLLNWVKTSTEPFIYSSSGRGFFIRISHQNQTMGVLVADNLSLPQYMKQYLNLSLMISDLCGLSIANARNIEKLKKTEAEERKERGIAETLRMTMSELASETSHEDLLEHILIYLSRVIPFSQAIVFLKQGDWLEYKSGLCATSSGKFVPYKPIDKYLNINAPWLVGTPLTLEDTDSHPEILHYVNTKKIRSWVGLPLLQGGEIIGYLSIGSQELGMYKKETVSLAQAFGAEVSIALENARLFKELTEAAITDSLTGLYNRRHLYDLATVEFFRSKRYKRPLSAVMIDIDFFKMINDTYGHIVGDQVLKSFANLCLQNIRSVDVIGRYGGEEFVVLLPETDHEYGAVFSERLRRLIADTAFETNKGPVQITCSMGIASLAPETKDLEQLLDESDRAMYQAKKCGRNRVCCWPEDDKEHSISNIDRKGDV